MSKTLDKKVSNNKDDIQEIKEYLRLKYDNYDCGSDEHCRYDYTHDVPKNVNDPELYIRARKTVKNRVKVWPSAYASGQLVQEYKKLGGTYKDKKSNNSNLDRWYKEDWVNLCEKDQDNQYKKCSDIKNKDYPYCRPSKRVSFSTPTTVDELKEREGDNYDKFIQDICEKKTSKTRIYV